MDVVAKLRFFRMSPRKVRPVLDLIRGRAVEVAETQLQHLPKRSAAPLLKLLKSAEANAEHNFKLDRKNLMVKRAFADEGPKLKRYQPHAMGRATLILKRSSHVTVVLAPREGLLPAPVKPHESRPTKLQAREVKGMPKAPRVGRDRAKASRDQRSPRGSGEHISHPGEKVKE